MTNDTKIPLIYRDLVGELSFDTLPSEWININLISFSNSISLFDYQQSAIKNALLMLYTYYESLLKYNSAEDEKQNIERKKKLFNEIIRFGTKEKEIAESLGITNKKNVLLFNRIKQYYPITKENSHEKVNFLNFVNRMSFWMATGSGKTIVLIKIIEFLDKLIQNKCIPNNDILILTHREDLIKQIKEHIQEFNEKAIKKIKIWDLKQYDYVKRGNVLSFKDEINIFIYRSDLISEDTKTNLLSFEDIENRGQWYVLLDEAHKGDKEDSKKQYSKRQVYYSLMSRNGFLFNFSATFTDPWDILTTVYNFNLDSFIRKGYGKNVYLSQQELNAFKDKKDFDNKDKQKIVLKSLVLLTLTKIMKDNISVKSKENNYHAPLMVSLFNSLNKEDSDLEMFFKELEKIAKGNFQNNILTEAKEELFQELTEYPKYVFGSESIKIEESILKKIEIKDILKHVFNTDSFGKIEVIKIPSNKKELIFKLKTSDKPFALTKIGDITKLLKKLNNYEINESYENESFFENIDRDKSYVNILMGLRAFYEGWDSNRPNVMTFINIGTGDAKKYVIQSIGRGVRIEPIKKQRKRLLPLKRENNIKAKDICKNLEPEEISIMETLFVFGTNKKNLQDILDSIKYERKTTGEIIELKENEMIKGKTLLIPIYKDKKETVKIEELTYEGNKTLMVKFFNWLKDERIFYALYSQENNLDPEGVNKVKSFLYKGNFKKSDRYDISTQLNRLITHVSITMQDIDKFKKIENEIIHFKRIKVNLENKEFKTLKELIDKVKNYNDPKSEEENLIKLFNEKSIDLKTYTQRIKELNNTSNEEEFRDLKIKHLLNHYYVPLILSKKEKVDYITHIVNVDSERIFLEQLDIYLKQKETFFDKFDWWMFSKLDQYLDDVYLPYYNREHNKIEKFKPDFIFWLKKKEEYTIMFVDPKGTKFTDYEYKVDGYRKIFENSDSTKKVFNVDNNHVTVELYLYTEDENKLSEGYSKYWFDNFDSIMKSVTEELN